WRRRRRRRCCATGTGHSPPTQSRSIVWISTATCSSLRWRGATPRCYSTATFDLAAGQAGESGDARLSLGPAHEGARREAWAMLHTAAMLIGLGILAMLAMRGWS